MLKYQRRLVNEQSIEEMELEKGIRKAHWEFFNQFWDTYFDFVCAHTRIFAEFVYSTRNCYDYYFDFYRQDAR